MKLLSLNKAKISLLATTIIISSSASYASSADDRYVYIGSELGLSEPVVKSFIHKESKTKIRLKQSKMLGGRVGYSFYPNMMVELSYTYQPKYGVAYTLPASATMPETPGRTKMLSNVITLNLIYEMQEQFAGIKPYVIAGAGIARMHIKEATSSFSHPAGNIEIFKVRKNNVNCFAWQLGGGFSRDLSENFSVDIGAKLQVVNDIKIKYDKFNPNTNLLTPQEPIKKTIGVGEFTLGFTFKLPV